MIESIEEELRKKKMLRSKHPTQKAYRVAVNNIDDESITVRELYKHADICKACKRKLDRAWAEKSKIIRAQNR